MPLSRIQKEQAKEELAREMASAASVILADYKGLTVAQVDRLRRKCEESEVNYRVVKNTLAKLAVEETDKKALADSFVGPCAVAYSVSDPVAPAKVLVDFLKAEKEAEGKFQIKAGIVDGNVLDALGVVELSKMPSKDELRSMLLSVLTAPARQLVTVLSAAQRDLLGVMNAYVAKQEEA